MARKLYGTKPLSKPLMVYGKWDRIEQNLVNFESIYNNFHAFDNVVCEMAAILSRLQCVKCSLNIETLGH